MLRTGGPGLAEDDVSGRLEYHRATPKAGGHARVPHHLPVGSGIGIAARGQAAHGLDLGIISSTPRLRISRGPCHPRSCHCCHLSPVSGRCITLCGVIFGEPPARMAIMDTRQL